MKVHITIVAETNRDDRTQEFSDRLQAAIMAAVSDLKKWNELEISVELRCWLCDGGANEASWACSECLPAWVVAGEL